MIDNLATVLGTVGDLVATVRSGQWRAATPCRAWNVHQLVNHMALGHQLFTGILRGTATVTPDALDPACRDALGADPVAGYRKAADDLLAAFAEPGVLDRTVVVPVGPVPGIVAAHLRTVEELVHGWDLGTAIGRLPTFPDAVVAPAVEFTRGRLADVPPDRSPFAAPQPVAADAPPLDHLVALLGRQP